MTGWIDIKSARPTISGEYNIKATGLFSYCNKCYYDVHTDHWTYDNGFWLPVSLDLYVTHWSI